MGELPGQGLWKEKRADVLFPFFVEIQRKERAEKQIVWSLSLECKSVLNLKKKNE